MTSIERAEAKELKKIEMEIRDMDIRLEQLKKKSAQQTVTNTEFNGKKKEIVFTRNQEEVTKDNLCHMYVQL